MSTAQPSQKRARGDDPSDSEPSKSRHLLISNDATNERSHALRDQLILVELLSNRDLDLETVTRPLVEQDYADIFCAITALEVDKDVHMDWVYNGPEQNKRLDLFKKAVITAGPSFRNTLEEATKARTFKLIRNSGTHTLSYHLLLRILYIRELAFLRAPFPANTSKPKNKGIEDVGDEGTRRK